MNHRSTPPTPLSLVACLVACGAFAACEEDVAITADACEDVDCCESVADWLPDEVLDSVGYWLVD